MLKLKKVAITGGISSGKSLVCKYLVERGAYTVNADKIVHELLNPNTELGKKIIKLVGTSVVIGDKIDRKRVAAKVFLNPTMLRSLEKLLHPRAYEEIERQYQECCNSDNPPTLFVAEVPLLFESGGETDFEIIVAVISDRSLCWERYRKSTGYEREDFNRRMGRQLTQHEKGEKSDFVIHNNGTIQELQTQVETLYDTLCGDKA